MTTPQLAAQRVAARAAAMVEKLGQPLLGVVENMSAYACPCCGEADVRRSGSGGGAALARDLGVPLLGEVPLEPALREGATAARRSSSPTPRRASRAIAAIAQRIAATRPAPAGRCGSPRRWPSSRADVPRTGDSSAPIGAPIALPRVTRRGQGAGLSWKSEC